MAKKAAETGEQPNGARVYKMVNDEGMSFAQAAKELGCTYVTAKIACMTYALKNNLKLEFPERSGREGRGNEAKFQFACRADEQAAIHAAAEGKGISKSEFIRNAVLKAAKFTPEA